MIAGPVTAASDPSHEVPSHPGERTDRIERALASLRAERRRCERLGLETPLARCVAQLRYWEFLAGVFALESPRSAK